MKRGSGLLVALLGLCTVPLLANAAAAPPASPAPDGSGGQAASGALSVMNFGAMPGCKSDATDGINRALKAAASAGGQVIAPAGTYCHDGLIIIPSGVTLRGEGDRTNLRATNRLQKYDVASWNSNQNGRITLNVSANNYIFPGWIVYVRGLSRSGQCNPNGSHIADRATPTTVSYMAEGCGVESGMGGTVQNLTPGAGVELTGKNVSLRNILITTTWPTSPNSPPPGWPEDFPFTPRQEDGQASAVFNAADGFVVDHVHVVGSANAGMLCVGCKNGSETSNKVENSLADGFEHQTCAQNIMNSDNVALHTGDDSYSVNSYQNEPCVCNHLTFTNDVSDSSLARGFEVDGGRSVTYTGGYVNNPVRACIFIHGGSARRYKMVDASDITVQNVAVSGCNGPAVYVHSDGSAQYAAANINISGITATNLHNYGVQVGDGKNFAHAVQIVNSTFTAAPGNDVHGAFFAGGDGVKIVNDTFAGFGRSCAAALGQHMNSGTLTIDRVVCNGNNVNGGADSAFHLMSTGFSAIHLTNSKVVNGKNPVPVAAHFGGEAPSLDVRGNTGQVTSVRHD